MTRSQWETAELLIKKLAWQFPSLQCFQMSASAVTSLRGLSFLPHSRANLDEENRMRLAHLREQLDERLNSSEEHA